MAEQILGSEFRTALTALAEWLESEKIPYAVIGGIAVSLTGWARATQDIDAVIWSADERWSELLTSAERFGFRPRIGDAEAFARRSRVFLLRHEATALDIDLSCGALPFEREMIEKAVPFASGDLLVKVAAPEDLIVTKLVAGRPKDLIDIQMIVESRSDPDIERIKAVAREFAEALDDPEILRNCERLLGR